MNMCSLLSPGSWSTGRDWQRGAGLWTRVLFFGGKWLIVNKLHLALRPIRQNLKEQRKPEATAEIGCPTPNLVQSICIDWI